jgi:plasmid stability protein
VRTTLNIDDDLLLALRDRARRQRRSLGEVVSELVRQALQERTHAGEVAESGAFYGFEPLPRRGPTVSNELIDRLRDDDGE